LLLADYLAYIAATSEHRTHSLIELGAGVGLSSIAALMFNVGHKAVIITDKSEVLLANAAHNIQVNQKLISRVKRNFDSSNDQSTSEEFMVVDWLNPSTWGKLEERLKTVGNDKEILFIAADVIYDPSLTENLFNMLRTLLPPGVSNRKLIISLEKRFNFSLSELCVKATGYDHFLSLLSSPSSSSSREEAPPVRDCGFKEFVGKRIDVESIEQTFVYERDSALELWIVTRSMGS